jgi:ParG protein
MTQNPEDPEDPSPEAQPPPALSSQAPTPGPGSPRRSPRAQPPSGPASDPVQILVGALSGLPPDDRDQVYVWLLHQRDTSSAAAPESGLPLAARGARIARSMRESFENQLFLTQSVRSTIASGQQMVPVRFSSEQHAQLRAWCAEHGFSMATVIRGLVARFLESQAPTSGEGGG